jgi:hypothetical protein
MFSIFCFKIAHHICYGFSLLLITQKKKAIVVTARVHPGETPASWMMKGFMDFLTGESLQARVSEVTVFINFRCTLYRAFGKSLCT